MGNSLHYWRITQCDRVQQYGRPKALPVYGHDIIACHAKSSTRSQS